MHVAMRIVRRVFEKSTGQGLKPFVVKSGFDAAGAKIVRDQLFDTHAALPLYKPIFLGWI